MAQAAESEALADGWPVCSKNRRRPCSPNQERSRSPHLSDGLRRWLRNLQLEHGRDSRHRNAISGGRVAHKHTPRPVRQLDHVPHARVRRRVQAADTVSSIHPLGPRSPSVGPATGSEYETPRRRLRRRPADRCHVDVASSSTMVKRPAPGPGVISTKQLTHPDAARGSGRRAREGCCLRSCRKPTRGPAASGSCLRTAGECSTPAAPARRSRCRGGPWTPKRSSTLPPARPSGSARCPRTREPLARAAAATAAAASSYS